MPQDRERRYIGSGETGLIIGAGRTSLGGSLKKAGAQVFGIGEDYMKKMSREDSEADLAQEKNRSALSWAGAQEEMSKMTDPKEISAHYNEWEESEREIVDGLDSNRLGKRAIGMHSEAALTRSRIQTEGAGGYVDSAYIAKNMAVWEGQKQNSLRGIPTDGFATPQDAYNHAVDKQTGLDPRLQSKAVQMKADFESSSNYHSLDGDLTAWQQDYNSGNFADPRDGLAALAVIQAEADKLVLKDGQRAQIDKTLGYREAALMKGDRRIREKIISDAASAQVEGNLDLEDLEPFYDAYPDLYGKLAARFNNGLSLREAGADSQDDRESAKQAALIISAHASGNNNTLQSLRLLETKVSNPSDVRTALVVMGYADYANDSGLSDYAVHDKLFGTDKKVSGDKNSFMSQVAKKTASYMMRGAGSSAWFEQTNKAALKWHAAHSHATPEEKQIQIRELFKEQATKEVKDSYRASDPISVPASAEDEDIDFYLTLEEN